MDNALSLQPPTTLLQWLAGIFRSTADRLDSGTFEPPIPDEVRREHLRAARVALLDAESESERYSHTVAMLRKRVARLGRAE